MSGRGRKLRKNKIEQLAELQVLWRGIAFHAKQHRGHWQLNAEAKT